jgi:hypothetical protein
MTDQFCFNFLCRTLVNSFRICTLMRRPPDRTVYLKNMHIINFGQRTNLDESGEVACSLAF